MHKLSASALVQYLRSPKAYYYRYILRLEPIQPSVANFGHDLLFGKLWAELTDRFYKGVAEIENATSTLADWLEGSEGWVPDKARDIKTNALKTLIPQYYQMFSPDDGCRAPGKSELWLENDRFVAKLDGLSDDGIIHECKTTSRAPQLDLQLWKIGNSIQVKLYCVMADAQGFCIELAFKDPPYQIFRSPVTYISSVQKNQWRQELNSLANSIYALGDDPHNYVCHTDCSSVTRNMVSTCQFQPLCEHGLCELTEILYKERERR